MYVASCAKRAVSVYVEGQGMAADIYVLALVLQELKKAQSVTSCGQSLCVCMPRSGKTLQLKNHCDHKRNTERKNVFPEDCFIVLL